MNWQSYYQAHQMTAAEAVGQIKSGDRVVVGHAVGEPCHLVAAMVANAAAYRDVEIVHMVAMGTCDYCKPEYEGHFRHNSFFLGGSSRKAVAESRADFTPCFFFELPKLFRTSLPVDVALISVTPPDENGKCSMGVSVDYTYSAAKQAKVVIAQVNHQMPRTFGTTLDVTDIDAFVLWDEPVLVLPPPNISEVEEAIGRWCATLIHDGDTLQLGIGAIPDAILRFLHDKKDLGIHSETFSDGVIDLAQSGVITNAKKTLHPGKFVSTLMMGTQRLYDFVNNNPNVELYPVEYSNHPGVIAQNDNMVSINSAIQVDLTGQVNAEMIGSRQFSGIGGQVDYIRGCALAANGRSIIAMPSVTKGVSKIVPQLDENSTVTTSRCDVDYVVTECGVAHLKGQTLRNRAKALIQIAHPDFRQALMAEYQIRFREPFSPLLAGQEICV